MAIIADIDNNICYSGAVCNIHVCHADKTANAVAALTILCSFDYIAFIRVYDHIFNRCADRNTKNTNTFRIAVNFNIFDRICLSVIMRSKI